MNLYFYFSKKLIKITIFKHKYILTSIKTIKKRDQKINSQEKKTRFNK